MYVNQIDKSGNGFTEFKRVPLCNVGLQFERSGMEVEKYL